MSIRREEIVRRRLEDLLDELGRERPRATRPDARIPAAEALACFEAGALSRLLDLEARRLKDEGLGFYTIGSAGHEANAVLGRLLRDTDPCLLHYRSGALMAARAARAGGEAFVRDTLLSLCASALDPVSGGRHKVWGSRRLAVPPQTSTIASHLPKAVGLAFAQERRVHLGLDGARPDDAIVVASFGDASVNHASATTAFNAAAWARAQSLPCPVLFVCEDNGLGISVQTPEGWIRKCFETRAGITYFHADGRDLPATWEVARRAVEHCRHTRRPAFLHVDVVRLMGHAGSDVELTYRDERTIERIEAGDPLLAWARWIVACGLATGDELSAAYDRLAARVGRVAAGAPSWPRLATVEDVAAPLRFPAWGELEACARGAAPAARRRLVWGDKLPEDDRPRHLAMQLGRALADLMAQHRELLVFGEDVARKGGVYHVTAGLYEKFGVGRVFNTLLDETMILGTAIGAAQAGFVPVPEVQYLAYLHNAEDQLRGEACSQRFFSAGQWDNPMVVRVAGLAYQKGFGGHFHNDDSLGVLRDVPGLVLALPCRGDDAVGMLRTCVAAAKVGRAVCAFVEPIALYMTRDLHEDGDGGWASAYPAPGEAVPLGEPRLYEAGRRGRVLVVTYGNGVPMALRARRLAGDLAEQDVAVLDLRWLAPLPVEAFLALARRAEEVVLLDECRRTGGGPSETLATALALDPEARGRRLTRITAADSYVPLGPAADLVLPQVDGVRAALERALSELVDEEGGA
ncbi:MAG: thiamine pyrophosphate-dependent enzyme [Planctomycetota bacterium]